MSGVLCVYAHRVIRVYVCVLTAYGIDEVCTHTVYRVLDG